MIKPKNATATEHQGRAPVANIGAIKEIELFFHADHRIIELSKRNKGIADFFYIAQAEDKNDFEDEGQFFGDVFLSLFIFYNLVENFPILFINSGILLKEASLPFF